MTAIEFEIIPILVYIDLSVSESDLSALFYEVHTEPKKQLSLGCFLYEVQLSLKKHLTV